MRLGRNIAAALLLLLAPTLPAAAEDSASSPPGPSAQTQPATAPSDADDSAGDLKPQTPDTDLFAMMSGTCSTLKIAGRDFACRTVAYSHSSGGRAYFTIALDDPADPNHIVSFSGDGGKRTNENIYDLAVDRMLLNSKSQPKADGLPVPAVVKSAGRCVQLGNFAAGRVTSIVCSATDRHGRRYDLRFESDGSPITVRRVNPSSPTIRGQG
ncbi:hypothetical protein [Bradyrhizobium sp.]|uniref:hypothetical protein n=1 Tax=Bradyrhizobium sp. TaxID=376 RepID=UPI0039C8B198